MKRILLLILIVISSSISAQSEYYISKPLRLNSVPQSLSKSDSVLVRGIDQIIKYVPRSEFGSGEFKTINGESIKGSGNITLGGGEIYPFQQVLASGNISDGINAIFRPSLPPNDFSVFAPSPEQTVISYQGLNINSPRHDNNNYNSNVEVNPYNIQISGSNGTDESAGLSGLTPTGLVLANQELDYTIKLKADPKDPNNNGSFTQTLQRKDGTVALLSDIGGNTPNFDQVLQSGNTSFNYLQMYQGGGGSPFYSIHLDGNGLGVDDGTYQSIYKSNGISLEDIRNPSSVKSLIISADPSKGIKFSHGNSSSTTLNLIPETLGGGQKYITIPNASGKISLAAVYTNTTTTALSLAQLTTAYPYLNIGDKVHCMNISGSPAIYEKTSTGWAQSLVSVVP